MLGFMERLLIFCVVVKTQVATVFSIVLPF